MRTVTEAERHLATTQVLACAAAHNIGMPHETLLQLARSVDSAELAKDVQPLWHIAAQLAAILLAENELDEEKKALEQVLGDAPASLQQPFRNACKVVQPTKVSQLD
jgi:hypothetical protein